MTEHRFAGGSEQSRRGFAGSRRWVPGAAAFTLWSGLTLCVCGLAACSGTTDVVGVLPADELPAGDETSELEGAGGSIDGVSGVIAAEGAPGGLSIVAGMRVVGWDGSTGGSRDGIVLRLTNPRALSQVITAPGSLGLARAYLLGDLVVDGIDEGDPYEVLKVLGDGLTFHRLRPKELAELAGFSAFQTERPDAPVAGQQGRLHPFEEAHGAADTVAGSPFALAAGISADVEVFEQHRIAEFQNLRVGQPRIGHVRMHRVGAVEAGAGRRA